MNTRETRSAPVIWVPHVVTSTAHGHSHSHSKDPYGRRDRENASERGRNDTYGRNLQVDDSNMKVFVVDYKKGSSVLCCALLFTLVHIAIGGLNMSVLVYSLSVGDLHSILLSAAYHLFSAEAIMAMSYKNGWSLLMGYDNRTMCHTILQILGLILAITGITVKLVETGVTDTAHCIVGILTAALTAPTLILGPVGLFRKSSTIKAMHMYMGLITFICATICFGLGMFKEKFQDWCKQTSPAVIWLMLVLLIYITLVMVILVICKAANVDLLRAERRGR